ncbi:unnamed protein product [Hydatigera taeniaeformis]|uniref:Voltage-dependent anion-selective channel n=1 Tax=Hydatigena taeniaeformis TaxID=6205 RepID=A0A0R3X1N6_HYDTA|nr:unnamed protein product [Hydatigera taeniaeformis]
MTPPTFADIGKSARDLLRKNFDLGVRFFSFKGKNDKLEFLGRVDNAFRVGKMLGTFESKYNLNEYGLILNEKWSSKGFMSADVSVDGQLMNGLCNTLKTEYDVESGVNRISLKSTYKNDFINKQVDFQFRHPLPDALQSLVIGYQDYLVGADLHYDTFRKELRRVDFAFAYSVKDFGFHAIITNWAHTFTAGIYQRLTDRLEYAAESNFTLLFLFVDLSVQMLRILCLVNPASVIRTGLRIAYSPVFVPCLFKTTWNRDVPDYNWAIACQIATDPDRKHILKIKLDSLQRISISLKSQIVEGVNTAVSAMFNDVEETQVGFGVEIER